MLRFTGANFTPNKTVTLKFFRGNATSPAQTGTVTAGCNGGFTSSLVTPLVVLPESDHVTACDTAGRCATAYFSLLV